MILFWISRINKITKSGWPPSSPLAIKLFNRQKAQVTVATNVIVAPVAEAFEQRNLRKQRSTRDAQRWFRNPAIRMQIYNGRN